MTDCGVSLRATRRFGRLRVAAADGRWLWPGRKCLRCERGSRSSPTAPWQDWKASQPTANGGEPEAAVALAARVLGLLGYVSSAKPSHCYGLVRRGSARRVVGRDSDYHRIEAGIGDAF